MKNKKLGVKETELLDKFIDNVKFNMFHHNDLAWNAMSVVNNYTGLLRSHELRKTDNKTITKERMLRGAAETLGSLLVVRIQTEGEGYECYIKYDLESYNREPAWGISGRDIVKGDLLAGLTFFTGALVSEGYSKMSFDTGIYYLINSTFYIMEKEGISIKSVLKKNDRVFQRRI